MSLYSDIKRCMIDAWPNGTVGNCVHMVCIDHGRVERLVYGVWMHYEQVNTVMNTINLPRPIGMKSLVSTYIAAHYPKTSKALFAGKDKETCRKIMMQEKAIRIFNSKKPNPYKEAIKEEKKSRAFRTIRARSLDKWHDWNTVK